MSLVAGVDSSTQSTKVEIRDSESGELVGSASAPHPAVTPPVSEQDPLDWWSAFEACWRQLGDPAVEAISVAGQQHGMVAVDADGVIVHPAKLWNDTESAADAERLVADFGGGRAFADAVGSVPLAAFTVTKLAWLRRTHPDRWQRVARVMLPHDWMTHRLTGAFVTDRGDASGTGYWSPMDEAYHQGVLALVDPSRDWTDVLPSVRGPFEPVGSWHGAVVGPGTGDNMAGALGLGLGAGAGDAVVSVGTSGTVYASTSTPTADPAGLVAGFGDATGNYLPLVCTSNASKVLDAVRRLLGVDHEEFDRLALSAEGSVPVLLPYLDGERTPNRPDATGVMGGIRSDVTREQFARAAVDGVVCGLLDGYDALARHAPLDGRVVLTGGGARSTAVAGVLAALIEAPVVAADVPEAVATGAAIQAAAVLRSVSAPDVQQDWGVGDGTEVRPVPVPGGVRERYAALRDATGERSSVPDPRAFAGAREPFSSDP